MNPDLDTLATAPYVTAPYVTVDDLLAAHPHWAPPRPAVGIAPKLSDAELLTLAALQALLRFDSEAQFLRWARTHLRAWFPYLPQRPGYNKRLRRGGELMAHVMAALARDCPRRPSTPSATNSDGRARARLPVVARRRVARGLHAGAVWAQPRDPTALRPGPMGHLRLQRQPLGWFWGLRLHLLATPAGLPIAAALTGATADERDTCLAMITHADPARPAQTLIADKGYRSADH